MDKLQFINDTQQNGLANSEPECMKNRGSVDVCREPLNREQLDIANKELISHSYTQLTFPRTQRLRNDPPIPQQNFTVLCFTPSKDAVPDKDGCFGVLKVRGCFDTEKSADEHCEHLIRNVDSYNENYITYVGKDFPICANTDKYCQSTKEVDIRAKLDNITTDKIRNEREKEKREMTEIQERHRQLLSDVKTEKKYDDLDFYTSLRTKVAQARMMQEEYEKKLKELGKTLKKTKQEVYELDEKYPEYQKQYEEQYKKALDAIGGDTRGNKMLEYMK